MKYCYHAAMGNNVEFFKEKAKINHSSMWRIVALLKTCLLPERQGQVHTVGHGDLIGSDEDLLKMVNLVGLTEIIVYYCARD